MTETEIAINASTGSAKEEGMNTSIHDLYVRYGPVVFRRSLRILGSEDKAYDVMQDVYIRLLEDSSIFNRMRSPVAYLYRMATNQSLNVLRRDKKILRGVELEAIPDLREEGMSAELLLDALVARFPEKTRIIAYYRYVDRMKLDEIAEAMEMSVPGIRKHLDSFRKRIQDMKEHIV